MTEGRAARLRHVVGCLGGMADSMSAHAVAGAWGESCMPVSSVRLCQQYYPHQ